MIFFSGKGQNMTKQKQEYDWKSLCYFFVVLTLLFFVLWLVNNYRIDNLTQENSALKEQKYGIVEQQEWELTSSYWMKGNFTKVMGSPSSYGSAGGHGGLYTDEMGNPYYWKDNIHYSNVCPQGEQYTGGAVYLDTNSVQINCGKLITKQVCEVLP